MENGRPGGRPRNRGPAPMRRAPHTQGKRSTDTLLPGCGASPADLTLMSRRSGGCTCAAKFTSHKIGSYAVLVDPIASGRLRAKFIDWHSVAAGDHVRDRLLPDSAAGAETEEETAANAGESGERPDGGNLGRDRGHDYRGKQ